MKQIARWESNASRNKFWLSIENKKQKQKQKNKRNKISTQ